MTRYSGLCAAAALAALLATPALAGPTRASTVSLAGAAPTVCTLGAPTLAASGDAVLSGSTPSSATVTISNFVDTSNATYIDGISITLNFDAMCNYASHFNSQTVTGALKDTTPVVAGSGPFLKTLNYQALLQWAGQNSVLNTNGTALKKGLQKNVAGSFSGTAALSITLIDPGVSTPLVAGTFTDQLTVQIGAAL